MRGGIILAALWAALLAGCGRNDDARLLNAASDAGSWLTNGRTYAEQRFSPLTQIAAGNVGRLGLAWEAPLESTDFGVEATPLEADGVLYVTSTWSRVFTFDARTGRKLWAYDPQVPREWLRQGCCKAVNRGVALWKDKVYVGAFGRLIALNAHTGKPVWVADTTHHKPNYSITGAPRIVKGKVIIGNGGADFAARGFVSAYDAQTGKLAWRVYTVPRDPKLGQEQPELQRAAPTWDPKHDWTKRGGGGGPWDGLSYDPQLNLIYVGTGNAEPGVGSGDSLFVCSILAIDADTGRLVWSYQTTPGDRWDFDAVQNLVQADLTVAGRPRKVLMQASKNGFFYVLDRATGELLSAEKYVRVTWADHVDLKTGRPVESPAADYRKGRALLFPSPYGGHNWQPMAYSPRTGLVYIPARDLGWVWDPAGGTWFYRGADGSSLAPADVERATGGMLIAWDPKTGRRVWTVPQSEVMNGGVLVTASDLVVQGTADGYIDIYDARRGGRLRRIQVGTGLAAPPMSYRIDGQQYIAVAAGWNGVDAGPRPNGQPVYDNSGRLIVLKLDGGAVPVAPPAPKLASFMAGEAQPAALVAKGGDLYRANCGRCHGLVGERTPFPDLRRMRPETFATFDEIVLRGAYRTAGMASFADVIDANDTRAIRAYLIDWARHSAAGAPPQPLRPQPPGPSFTG
ncbi:MAG: PQQ-dependent dehydrogenase, methanol/ethanol family [Phenylobacterium sp.]